MRSESQLLCMLTIVRIVVAVDGVFEDIGGFGDMGTRNCWR